MQIRKAERRRAHARISLVSPAGGGKSHSALLLAKGLAPNGKIGVIDSENSSAEMEAGKPGIPEYDVLVLTPPFSPARYVEAIHLFEKEGYDVIIVDSLTHAWTGTGGALEMVDRIASSSKNSYTAWRDVTPQHNALVDAMLQSSAHIIATLRTKTEYVLEENDKGKKVPRKIGLEPIQRSGMDFEFTIVFDIDQQKHYAKASKDRTSLFDNAIPEVLTSAHGEKLRLWLEGGAAPVVVADPPMTNATLTALVALCKAVDAKHGDGTVKKELAKFAPDAGSVKKLTESQANTFDAILRNVLDAHADFIDTNKPPAEAPATKEEVFAKLQASKEATDKLIARDAAAAEAAKTAPVVDPPVTPATLKAMTVIAKGVEVAHGKGTTHAELEKFAPGTGTIKKLTEAQAVAFTAILSAMTAPKEDDDFSDELPEHDLPPPTDEQVDLTPDVQIEEHEPPEAPVAVTQPKKAAPPAEIDPAAITPEAAQKTDKRQYEQPYLGRRVFTAGVKALSLAKLRMAWEAHVKRCGKDSAVTIVSAHGVTSFFDCDEATAKAIEAELKA